MKKTFLSILLLIFSFIVLAPVDGSTQKKENKALKVERSRFSSDKYYYEGKEISEKKFLAQLCKFEESIGEWKTSKDMSCLAKVLGFAGGFLIGWPVGESLRDDGDPNWAIAGGGLVIFAGGFLAEMSSRKHRDRAIEVYNKMDRKIESSNPGNFDIAFSMRGLQLKYSF